MGAQSTLQMRSLRVNALLNKHIVKHIVGALCPSKSGLMNKHIVETCGGFVWVSGPFVGLAGSMYALYPSKSGLLNKHIVKHIVNKHIVKHIAGFNAAQNLS